VTTGAGSVVSFSRPPQSFSADGDRATLCSPRKLVVFGCLAVLGVALLTSLGVWQVERRAWKLDLIDQVERRVHAAPVPAPGPALWPRITAAKDAYRHVSVTGHFLDVRPALVQAVTERGGGYWVLAPFRSADGFTILINRGFIPADHAEDKLHAAHAIGDTVMLTGLLRVTEPGGGFLRHNDPGADRWYSRDVAAIATARAVRDVAPYFIDANASAEASGAPIGGLTVITFPNNHLVYAVTWFGLAIMLAGWSLYAARQEWRIRRFRAAGIAN
jgi:surfeit locus 1 family protein